jgi:hypothetical protein
MKDNFFPNKITQILVLFIVSLLLTMPLFLFVNIQSLPKNDMFMTLFYSAVSIVFILIVFFVNYRKKQKFELDLQITNFRLLSLMLLVIFIFQIGINYPVNNIIDYLLNKATELNNPFNRLYYVLGGIIIAPILEEIIYRGIILKGLLTRFSSKNAIILSALIFGLVHGKPQQMWQAFFIGLFFGFIYYKTKNIGTTILLHAFANISILIYQYILFKLAESNSMNASDIILPIVSAPVIFLIIRQLILKYDFINPEIIKFE